MTDVLSGLDSLFLHLETPRTPMHAASIAVFEGEPLKDDDGRLRIAELRDGVEARINRLPRLRQRVRRDPLHLLPPVWEDDSHFDIAAHVRHAAVPEPGAEKQLLELCAEVLSWPLDLTRPLWELWFIEGLAGNKVAVFQKYHHALSDGLGGVELASVLLDVTRQVEPEPPSEKWQPAPRRQLRELVAHDLANRSAELSHGLALVGDGLRHPFAALSRVAATAEGLGSLFAPTALAPRSSVNVPIGQHRRLAVVRQSLDALHRAGQDTGATVNDLLLTAVAVGVRALVRGRGQDADELQVLVPVGLEHEPGAELANRVSAMLVRLPLDVEDPVELLDGVAAVVSRAKAHHQSRAGHLLTSALDLALEPVIGATGLVVQHQPFVNLVVTNVPGSPVPLYASGARLEDVIPIVPIAGNLSVGVAALSYERRLVVGINADRERCPDIDVMARGMKRAFAALTKARAKPQAKRQTGRPAKTSAA